jgi:single-strand DNA-binding protein
MNTLAIIGRLVAEPELRFTPNGVAVANCRIAVNGAGNFISQEEGNEAGFFSVVVWGKTAQNLADYCHQGREIAVQGRLSQRHWEGDNGTVYVTEIQAERIDFLREPKGQEQEPEPERQAPKGKGKPQNKPQGNSRGGNSRGR